MTHWRREKNNEQTDRCVGTDIQTTRKKMIE